MSCRLDQLTMLVFMFRGLYVVYVLLLLVGILFLVGHSARGGICTSISHLAWMKGPCRKVPHLIKLVLYMTGYFSTAGDILMHRVVQLTSTLGATLCWIWLLCRQALVPTCGCSRSVTLLWITLPF